MNLFELFVKIDAEDSATPKIKETGDEAEKAAKGGLTSFTNKLGKGIATAAKIGAAAVGVAASAISALVAQSINSFAEYEQLAGGAAKIFNDMDQSKILQDAKGAYKDLGMSANEYLAVINDVGASFANTMGDEKGYETARKGLKAIADYASGTGKNVDELSQKFTMITRSTSSYQSIADQFSGILPATSGAFLKQAQAAGLLDKKYRSLTQVPIDDYQEAVAGMLEKGTEELGLANNAASEAMTTISGALTATKASWENLVTGLVSGEGDISSLVDSFTKSIGALAGQIVPKIGTALKGASSLISEIFPVIMEEIPKIITENLPKLVEAAISIIQSLVDGISQNQEMLMETAFETITYLATSLISMLPQIVELGLDLMVSLAEGIVENVDELLPAALEAITTIGTALIDNAPELINAGVELASAIMDGVLEQFQGLEPIIMGVVTAFGAYKAITLACEIASKAMAAAQWLVNAAMNANPIILIVTLIAGLVAAIITLWNTNDDFRNAIISAWEGIKETATSVFTAVASFFTETIPNAFQSMVDWIRERISSFISIGSQILTGIYNGIVGSVRNLYEAAIDIIKNLVQGIGDNLSEIVSAGEDIIENIVAGAEAFFSSILEVGKEIVEQIKEGISQAWEGLKSWFNDLWDSLFGDKEVKVDVKGNDKTGSAKSNANGLSYVPYDGYIALLHEGERVLTANEAKEYNSGYSSGASGSGITIVQNIQTVPQTPVEFAAATEAYFEQARWAF